MRVTAEVGQLDDLALLGRKAGHRVADRGALERKRDVASRIGRRQGVGDFGLQLTLLALAAAAATQIVDASIPDGRQQPRPQRAAVGIKACGVIPDVHERVLDGVLRPAWVAKHAQRHAVGEGCVAVVKLGERLMVAGREPRGETRLAALVATPRYDVPASCGVRRPVRSPMGDFLGGLIAHSSFSISRQAHRGSMRTRSRAA